MKEKLYRWIRSRRFWKRIILASVIIPGLLLAVTLLIVHQKQDEIVAELMSHLNEDFTGSAEFKDSHISFISNFPYISIDLEEFKVFESKENLNKPLIKVEDVYVGFNL